MIIKYKIGNAERKTTGTFTERDYVRKVAEDQHPSHWPWKGANGLGKNRKRIGQFFSFPRSRVGMQESAYNGNGVCYGETLFDTVTD